MPVSDPAIFFLLFFPSFFSFFFLLLHGFTRQWDARVFFRLGRWEKAIAAGSGSGSGSGSGNWGNESVARRTSYRDIAGFSFPQFPIYIGWFRTAPNKNIPRVSTRSARIASIRIFQSVIASTVEDRLKIRFASPYLTPSSLLALSSFSVLDGLLS